MNSRFPSGLYERPCTCTRVTPDCAFAKAEASANSNAVDVRSKAFFLLMPDLLRFVRCFRTVAQEDQRFSASRFSISAAGMAPETRVPSSNTSVGVAKMPRASANFLSDSIGCLQLVVPDGFTPLRTASLHAFPRSAEHQMRMDLSVVPVSLQKNVYSSTYIATLSTHTSSS